MLMRDYLASFGYSVGVARTGRQSLEQFKEKGADLIVMDDSTQDMDGITLIRALLREDLDVNVLMCVSRGQRSVAVEAIAAGAKDFITKPIDPKQLKKVIRTLVG